MTEPTKEMLEYASKHHLKYLPDIGGWCFHNTYPGGIPFSMHYSEIEELIRLEKEKNEDSNIDTNNLSS